jgi:DNA uptake protein ComE-like DNA-binding protein
MKHKSLVNLLVLLVTVCLATGFVYGQDKKSSAKKTAPATKTEKKAEQIDINSATKQQLMTLSGIGDATAQKIIDGRPYRAKNQLVQKNIITQAVYDKISAQIIAKQDTAAKKAAPADKGTAKKGAGKK